MTFRMARSQISQQTECSALCESSADVYSIIFHDIFSFSLRLRSIPSISSILILFTFVLSLTFLFHYSFFLEGAFDHRVSDNNARVLHLLSAPLGGLLCSSWFKNRLIIQMPLQHFVYQTAEQMKSRFCFHPPVTTYR